VPSLAGKTVIVSGAASGIGLAAAEQAVRVGARVALLDRSATVVAALARRWGEPAVAVPCDVTVAADIDRAVTRVREHFGPVHGLVTSAGIERGEPSHEVTPAAWQATLATNLTGTFLLAQAVLAAHRQAPAESLSIVFVSSPAAFVGFPAGHKAAYSAAKGGVSALVRALAVEYGRAGVRVNAVVPGATETPLMWANVPAGAVAATRRQIERDIPLGRLALPAEIAPAILWLLSAESGYVTGTHLVCDGGLLATAPIAE
jgi:NAD(P)-dependent dehydrogenase (short-subunit alcohol dehydrogenase family)